MTSTLDSIRALMAREFNLDARAIQADTPLTELGVDSLAALEFVFDLEEAFNITLDPQTDLRGGRVSDVVAAVDSALAGMAAHAPAE
jgi:acyl carrier protein